MSVGPKYPIDSRGPSYGRYLLKLKRRRAWKRVVRVRKDVKFLTRKADKQVFPVGLKKKLPKISREELERATKQRKFRKPDEKIFEQIRKDKEIEKARKRLEKLAEPPKHKEKKPYEVTFTNYAEAEAWAKAERARGRNAFVDSRSSKIGLYHVSYGPYKSGGKHKRKLVPVYLGEHGIDSGRHMSYTVGKDKVEIYPPARDELEGYMLPWRVVWEGGVDFEGNKRDLLKRYPEFRKALR